MGSAREHRRTAAPPRRDGGSDGPHLERSPAVEPEVPARGPASGRWIVADGAPVGAGQVRHGELFATLRRDLFRTCDAELARVGRTATDCPYLTTWLAYYEAMPPEHVERAIGRYAGADAASGAELAALVVERARRAVATWVETGALAHVPGEVDDGGAVGVEASPAGGALVAAPYTIAQAVGVVPGDVRIRRDAAITARADAYAVTVGRDIALAPDAPAPGTLEGDLLLAHELAHVAQQAAPGAARPGAAHEADADRAAVAAVRGSRGGGADAHARPSLTSGLALQRCGKGRSKGKEDAALDPARLEEAGVFDDAGVPSDAATPDAGAPAGYHLSTRTVEAAGTIAATSELSNLEEFARRYYGARSRWPMLQQSNPGVSDRRIRTDGRRATQVDVPGAVLYQPAPEFTIDSSQPGNMGYQTWYVERDPRGEARSRTASYPGGESGVTLGHGYDMGARSGDTIVAELTAAGVPAATAEMYRTAARQTGPRARTWVAAHADIPAISAAAELRLFQQEYRRTADQLIDFVGKVEWGRGAREANTAPAHWIDFPDRGYQQVDGVWRPKVDLSSISPTILELLIDLRLKGNLTPTSWAYLVPAIRANDVAALGVLIQNKAGYRANISDNYNRYQARCAILGVTPVTTAVWNAP